METEPHNDFFSHFTLEELKEDLERMEDSRDKGEDFFSEEIFLVEQEIEEREEKNKTRNFENGNV